MNANQEKTGMRMKSYFVASVEAAVEQARQELGPDALLVNTRKAPPEARHLGEYEVVFAVLPQSAGEAVAAEARPSEPGDPVMCELTRLRRQVEEMGSALNGLHAHASSWAVAPEYAEIFSRLLEQDFAMDIAKKIVKGAQARLESDPASWSKPRPVFDAESIETAVRMELEAHFEADASLEAIEQAPRVLALVGPPGSGKTSTLVKLAVRYGVAARRPVHLISADTQRVAGAEQLRTYAAIISAGFDVAETTRGIEQIIDANRNKGLILVDTQGYAANEMDGAAELAGYLSRRRNIEVQLVASASMRAADLSRVVDRFAVFSPVKLIFTHLDETGSYGAVMSESVRTAKPLSFLTAGQQIPDDLEPATATRLINRVLARPRERAFAVA